MDGAVAGVENLDVPLFPWKPTTSNRGHLAGLQADTSPPIITPVEVTFGVVAVLKMKEPS